MESSLRGGPRPDTITEAMEHSQKASAKKLVKRVLGKNRDDSDRIILTEKDFN